MSHYNPDDPTARVSAHEVQVPGSPEQVWRAIATGPGIATWFVPAQVQEHPGGRIVTDHDPYGTSEGVVTDWEPPVRFGYEEPHWDPTRPDAPTWATEVLVEATDGGTCIVRLVSGFFSGGDGWEDNLKGTAEGWTAALRNLRLSLTHFPGLAAAMMGVHGKVTDRSPDEVGTQLLTGLGLADVSVGEQVRLAVGPSAVTGTVVDTAGRSVTVLTQQPHPGILEMGVFDHGGAAVVIRWYLYGPGADDVAAARSGPWSEWIRQHIPRVRVLEHQRQ